MPKIPRAERRVDPTIKAAPIQQAPRAAVGVERGLQAVGQALVGVGQTIGDIQAAQARHKLNQATSQALIVSSKIKDDMANFTASALGLKGTNANVGTIEYNKAFDNSFLRHTVDFDDTVKAAVLQKVTSSNDSMKLRLAEHQVTETKNGALTAINTSVDVNLKEATISPENLPLNIEDLEKTINANRPVLGDDETDALIIEKTDELVGAFIDNQLLTDPEGTLEDLESGQFREFATTDLITEKTEIARKEVQRAQKQAEADAKKLDEEAEDKWFNSLAERQAEGKPMTAPEIAEAPIDSKKKKTLIDNVANDPTVFEQTDEGVKANLTARMSIEGDVTSDEIWSKVGKGKNGGLSTDDAKALDKKLKTGAEDDPLQIQYEKQAYRLIEFMRKDQAFIDAGGIFFGPSAEELEENNLRAAQQVNSLAEYIVEHPDENYVETYIQPVLKPAQEGFIAGVYDKATGFFTDEPAISIEEDIDIRRQATDLLTEKNITATRENINRASALIREGKAELKILDTETAQRLFKSASGTTNEEKKENARRNAIKLGFFIP